MIRDTGPVCNHQNRSGGYRVVTGKARSYRVVTTITTVTTREEAYTRVRAHARARMNRHPSTGGNSGYSPVKPVTHAKKRNHQGGYNHRNGGNSGGYTPTGGLS